MGLDYGDKTVGVAVSDAMLMTAQPLETIHRERAGKLRRTFARIEEIIEEYDVERIVVGLPLSMNDEEGTRAAVTREFGEKLGDRTGLDIVYQDERLSTFEADEVLGAGGVKAADRKKYVDKLAASVILRSYLDSMDR